MVRISVIILTYNEEKHIERAIRSVRGIASQIFVVDSKSKDNTVEIAERNGAIVLENDFVNQAVQFNWALDNAPIDGDWILRLDADEVIEESLAEEICRKLPLIPADVVGVNLKRKHIFMNRWIRYGGRYPLLMLRLWRRGHGRVEDRWMDEHVFVQGGRTITIDGGFSDHNLNDITYFIDKHNKYATREALEVINQRYGLFSRAQSITVENASAQAALKRFIKENIFNKIPFALSAFLYFIWRYFFQLGFMDGSSGLVYHFLQGCWYRFLVGAKVMELEKGIAHLSDKDKIVSELSRLTGYKLN